RIAALGCSGVTMSVGVAEHDGHASADELLHDADMAMYVAKSSGRNLAVCFDVAMRARVGRRREMQAALAQAIERQELHLCFLPKMTLEGASLLGFESLLRWRSPDYGELAPSEFITLAEEGGAIMPIGRWVLEEA